MHTDQLNEILNAYLQQLYQWKQLLTVVSVEPSELESVLLELHNSVDLINAYTPADFNKSHLFIMADIDKALAQIEQLNQLLANDIAATQIKPLPSKFNLYQASECGR